VSSNGRFARFFGSDQDNALFSRHVTCEISYQPTTGLPSPGSSNILILCLIFRIMVVAVAVVGIVTVVAVTVGIVFVAAIMAVVVAGIVVMAMIVVMVMAMTMVSHKTGEQRFGRYGHPIGTRAGHYGEGQQQAQRSRRQPLCLANGRTGKSQRSQRKRARSSASLQTTPARSTGSGPG
jgi:hypothetical protein